MSDRPGVPDDESVMAPHGFYNRNSTVQAAAATLGRERLRRAASRAALPTTAPVVVADYGVAQGANSMGPIDAALDEIRSRTDAPIQVVHTDLPSNDFASLFELFAHDTSSYLRGRDEVYPYAIGRSFYGQLFPSSTVSLGWSATTTHWLSRTPRTGIGTLDPMAAAPGPRAAFAEQATDDWASFLTARAAELRPGGRLVMVQPCAHPDGRIGSEGLMRLMREAADALAADGIVTRDERDAMVLPFWMRTPDEYAAPVEDIPHLHLLASQLVEHPPNPLREQFERDGDAGSYAAAVAAATRGWSEGMLFGSVADPDAADMFYRLLGDLGAGEPEALYMGAWTLVLDIERTAAA